MTVSKVSTVEERIALGLSPAQLDMLFTLDGGNADDVAMMIHSGKGWRRTAHILERRGLIERRSAWRLTVYGRQILNIVDADVAARAAERAAAK